MKMKLRGNLVVYFTKYKSKYRLRDSTITCTIANSDTVIL